MSDDKVSFRLISHV